MDDTRPDAVHVVVDQGRDAFRRRAWALAHASLSAAGRHGGLELDDLERLAVAAHLVGECSHSEQAWTGAFPACLARGQTRRAVGCAAGGENDAAMRYRHLLRYRFEPLPVTP